MCITHKAMSTKKTHAPSSLVHVLLPGKKVTAMNHFGQHRQEHLRKDRRRALNPCLIQLFLIFYFYCSVSTQADVGQSSFLSRRLSPHSQLFPLWSCHTPGQLGTCLIAPGPGTRLLETISISQNLLELFNSANPQRSLDTQLTLLHAPCGSCPSQLQGASTLPRHITFCVAHHGRPLI